MNIRLTYLLTYLLNLLFLKGSERGSRKWAAIKTTDRLSGRKALFDVQRLHALLTLMTE